jgi:hypothetical protein
MIQIDPVASLTDALHHAVSQAVRAPSSHNTQPWRFRARGARLDLLADRTRSLPVVDPDGRELIMSCGAALFQLRAALRAASLDVSVSRLPDPADGDLIARLDVRPGGPPTEDERTLAKAIPGRHTVRAPYLGLDLPEAFIAQAQRDAAAEGAWLVLVTGEAARTELVALVMEADHQQWSDPRFRHELSGWMRPNDSDARDGLFGFAEGLDNVASHLAPLATRLLDLGSRQAIRDRDLADGSPVLAILGTDGDAPMDWVRAGEALDRVLLRAESEDVAAAFLNQPVEVAELRPRLREIAGRAGYPQAVLRMGYGRDQHESRRRPIAEVLV